MKHTEAQLKAIHARETYKHRRDAGDVTAVRPMGGGPSKNAKAKRMIVASVEPSTQLTHDIGKLAQKAVRRAKQAAKAAAAQEQEEENDDDDDEEEETAAPPLNPLSMYLTFWSFLRGSVRAMVCINVLTSDCSQEISSPSPPPHRDHHAIFSLPPWPGQPKKKEHDEEKAKAKPGWADVKQERHDEEG